MVEHSPQILASEEKGTTVKEMPSFSSALLPSYWLHPDCWAVRTSRRGSSERLANSVSPVYAGRGEEGWRVVVVVEWGMEWVVGG